MGGYRVFICPGPRASWPRRWSGTAERVGFRKIAVWSGRMHFYTSGIGCANVAPRHENPALKR